MAGDKTVYDYTHSTISQDRDALREVQRAVAERQQQQQQEDEQTGRSSSGSSDNTIGAAVEARNDANGDAQSSNTSEDEDGKAARALQKGYRRHTEQRSAGGMNISASARWTDGLRRRRLEQAGQGQSEGNNDPTARWQRSATYAKQLGRNQSQSSAGPGISQEEMSTPGFEMLSSSKAMEGQYWLEMVDSKHRYGSNLKWYHQRWNEEDTEDNFFEWLDNGEGKTLSLDQCPRERLDTERVTYLTKAQRNNYRVRVDKQGRLCWRKNGELVDTGAGKWKDGGPDKGIVARDGTEDDEEEDAADMSDSSSSSSSISSMSSTEKQRVGVKGYDDKGGTAMRGKGLKQMKERVGYYASPKIVVDKLLRKTLRKNTWIYVADSSFNLYIGIKTTGRFQHSSFLGGGRVTSAGLLKVRDGQLVSLSPLSGHYRAGTPQFKGFVQRLQEQGVDMSEVSVSKALAVIGSLEKLGQAKSWQKGVKKRLQELTLKGKQDEDGKKCDKCEASPDRHSLPKPHIKPKKQHRQDSSSSNDSLPGDGKPRHQLTDAERLDRGVVLVQRALDRQVMQISEKHSSESG